MPAKQTKGDGACCPPGDSKGAFRGVSRCRVDALITIDGRGQIVLPKDLRARAGIEKGDKLAVISWESDGQVCCLSLIKADEFGASIKGLLAPMMEEILQG
jgi:AbrB family looped-hinge helix DNA binding protein